MFNSLLYFCFAICTIGEVDENEMSKAIGHMIGKTIQTIGIGIDIEAIAKGIQEEVTGLPSPLTDEECLTMLDALEKKRQIKEANDFLAVNGKEQGVTSLASGKLQYKILQEGKGDAVQSYNSPFVRLKQEGANAMVTEEILSLDDLIQGLKLGIVGMQEGEIRKFYIHPELGYENQSSLLIFEVEIIKADASYAAHAASNREDIPVFRR